MAAAAWSQTWRRGSPGCGGAPMASSQPGPARASPAASSAGTGSCCAARHSSRSSRRSVPRPVAVVRCGMPGRARQRRRRGAVPTVRRRPGLGGGGRRRRPIPVWCRTGRVRARLGARRVSRRGRPGRRRTGPRVAGDVVGRQQARGREQVRAGHDVGLGCSRCGNLQGLSRASPSRCSKAREPFTFSRGACSE